jgi:4-hydroxythreonine-4-phosphate dehydrogenase
MGEPAGIGPEVAVAAYKALNGGVGRRPLRLIGDPDVFLRLGIEDGGSLLRDRLLSAKSVPGKPDPANAGAVISAIETAATLAISGAVGAIVTAPIHKAVLNQAGFAFPGHTEFLAHLTGARRAVMMLASDELRAVPLTIHIPMADVPAMISKQLVFDTAEIVLTGLRRDFGILNPRLAVAGLNPHAGEDGRLGAEEITIIAPAVAALRARAFNVRGPLSADTLFHAEARQTYDAALCMYHDQALIPIKALSFWNGVNVTLGLPIVRTSPDHGTALDIAGTGKADARSMIAAVKLAAEMADARARGS